MPVKSKKIDHYEKRFGVVAIEMGFITSDELINGLKVQVQEDVELGYHRLIGEIFLDRGDMSEEQIAEVLKEILM